MKEIVLYHWRNRDAFIKVFPTADFLYFETGIYFPHFLISAQDWIIKKSDIPKSCKIHDVIDLQRRHNHNELLKAYNDEHN